MSVTVYSYYITWQRLNKRHKLNWRQVLWSESWIESVAWIGGWGCFCGQEWSEEESSGKKIYNILEKLVWRLVAGVCESLESARPCIQDDSCTVKGNTWRNGDAMRLSHGIVLAGVTAGAQLPQWSSRDLGSGLWAACFPGQPSFATIPESQHRPARATCQLDAAPCGMQGCSAPGTAGDTVPATSKQRPPMLFWPLPGPTPMEWGAGAANQAAGRHSGPSGERTGDPVPDTKPPPDQDRPVPQSPRTGPVPRHWGRGQLHLTQHRLEPCWVLHLGEAWKPWVGGRTRRGETPGGGRGKPYKGQAELWWEPVWTWTLAARGSQPTSCLIPLSRESIQGGATPDLQQQNWASEAQPDPRRVHWTPTSAPSHPGHVGWGLEFSWRKGDLASPCGSALEPTLQLESAQEPLLPPWQC